MNIDEVITGLTVTWKYKEVIEKSYTSIRRFHPNMRIMVVDGSDRGMPCYKYLNDVEMDDDHLKVYYMYKNIGHGRGMHYGLSHISTPYALIFDSDIEMVKSPVQGMLDMMEDDTFGAGYIEIVAPDGHDYGILPRHKGQPKVKYLHPYFQLIQIKEYKKYKSYIHHGAPCVSTALDIHKKGLSDKVLKVFPGLGHTSGQGVSWDPVPGEYLKHDVGGFGGTGRRRIQENLPHIEGAWERVI